MAPPHLARPHPPDISDPTGARAILDAVRQRWPWVKHVFANGAYDGLKLIDKAAFLDSPVAIVRRRADAKVFEVRVRRWAEPAREPRPRSGKGWLTAGARRSLGWMTRWRHLARDYEAPIDVSEVAILVARGGNMLRRNARPAICKRG